MLKEGKSNRLFENTNALSLSTLLKKEQYNKFSREETMTFDI